MVEAAPIDVEAAEDGPDEVAPAPAGEHDPGATADPPEPVRPWWQVPPTN